MIIILEKDNKNLNKSESDDSTDYTKIQEDAEEDKPDTETDDGDTEDPGYEEDGTDYTAMSEDPDADETDTETDDEGTDYTAEDDGAGEENETSDDVEDPDYGDDTTDYTDDSGIETEDGEYTSEDDNTEEADTEDGTDETEVSNDEKQAQRELLNDFIVFYRSITSFKSKLSNTSVDMTISSVVTQVIKNLSLLENYIYDYIIRYKNYTYTQNLYKYNYYLEAFKINVEMIKMAKTLKS